MQEEKSVAYASRSLSKSESNCATIELHSLLTDFAINKFEQCVYVHPNVIVHTDHRPLEAIMNKSLIAAQKRKQAIMLVLQR